MDHQSHDLERVLLSCVWSTACCDYKTKSWLGRLNAAGVVSARLLADRKQATIAFYLVYPSEDPLLYELVQTTTSKQTAIRIIAAAAVVLNNIDRNRMKGVCFSRNAGLTHDDIPHDVISADPPTMMVRHTYTADTSNQCCSAVARQLSSQGVKLNLCGISNLHLE